MSENEDDSEEDDRSELEQLLDDDTGVDEVTDVYIEDDDGDENV